MKTQISHELIYIAHKVSKIPGVKWLFKPIYYSYKKRIADNRNKLFIQNASSVMKTFDEVFNGVIPYCLAFGSMLGAVREHSFIKHDSDVDVFIWNKDYSKKIDEILNREGFKRIHRFVIDGGKLGREETYVKNHVAIDFFYVYTNDNETYTSDFSCISGTSTWEESMKKYGMVRARKFSLPISKQFIRMPFEDYFLNVPSNYDEFLTKRYGKDYMVPNPKWINGESPYITEWEGIKATYSE